MRVCVEGGVYYLDISGELVVSKLFNFVLIIFFFFLISNNNLVKEKKIVYVENFFIVRLV